MRPQELEAQPQQLAVVVDRSFSTVQDLIDNTACMVRVMCSGCQCANCTYNLASPGQYLHSAVRANCLRSPRTAQAWIASLQTVVGAAIEQLGAGLFHSPAPSCQPVNCCRVRRRQRRLCGGCSSSWQSAWPSATAR